MPAITRTRQRYSVTNSTTGVFQALLGTSPTFTDTYTINDLSVQKTTSQGNKWLSKAKQLREYLSILHTYGYIPSPVPYDLGGPFQTYQFISTSFPRVWFDLKGGNPAGPNWTYKGQAAAWIRAPSFSTSNFLAPSTNAELDAYGSIAIARCLPTNPLVGMGQFLGELRDFPKPPQIAAWRGIVKNIRVKHKDKIRKLSKEAAGEYLNYVFGWAPMLKDLGDFAKVHKNAIPIMKKYYDEANRPIHRQYHFKDETKVVTEVVSQSIYPDPSLNVYLWSKSGVLTKTTTTTTKRWFKGCFMYYLPKLKATDDALERFGKMNKIREAMMNKLFGLRITFDLAYKLTPWTWLIDWNSSVGSVVHNWQAFCNDGLVMKYGYMMETKMVTITYSLVGVQSYSMGKHNFVQDFTYITKSRRRATPYGFGLNPSSFSAKQWSIIAALGISRIPRSL